MNVFNKLSPVAVAMLALLAMPAVAQVDTDCTGSNPGTVTCTGVTSYADGVTHSATTGDLTVNVGGGVTSFGTGGFTTTATGNHSITMTKGSGAMGTAAATGTTAPAVISAVTEDGDIRITTTGVGNIQGVAASSQYGVYAQSTGSGDIELLVGQQVTQGGTAANAGIAAVHAQSDGGDIHVKVDYPAGPGAFGITGRLYGIRALAGGAGNILIDVDTPVRHSTTAGVGIAAIEAIADTGSIVLNLNQDTPAGQIVSLQSDGSMTLNLAARLGGTNNAHSGALPIHLAGAGAAAVNILGGDSYGTLYGGIDARDHSGGLTVDIAPLSSGWSLYGESLKLGSGDDLIRNRGLLLLSVNATDQQILLETFADMGAGTDRILNEGTVVIGASLFNFGQTPLLEYFFGRYGMTNFYADWLPQGQAEVTNLEVFENRGLIVLGAKVYNGGLSGIDGSHVSALGVFGQRFYPGDEVGEGFCRKILGRFGLPNPPPNGYACLDSPLMDDTDRVPGTALLLPGTHWIGGEGSRILLDAYFGEGLPQGGCGGAREAAYPFRMPGADCLGLAGGSTEGHTALIVRDGAPWDQGAYNPEGITVIDVNGGTSAAGHFTLSPESDHYRELADGRGVIDKGLFAFPLVYDESTQQHKLVGVPGSTALQLPLLLQASQTLARQTLGAGLDGRVRNWQTALRAGAELHGGFWGGLQYDAVERDVTQSVVALGDTINFNNDFDQDTTTMLLGGDFVLPAEGSAAWVVGGSIGYARADLDFAVSRNRADVEGVVLGVHGGYQTGGWYVNAAYGQSFLRVDQRAETYNLSDDSPVAHTDGDTQGLRLDGGLRLALGEQLQLQPLASLTWVRANLDDLSIESPQNVLATSNRARFDGATSLRAAFGARVDFDQALSGLRINYALTGRYWNELEGKTKVHLQSLGAEVAVADTFDGNFLDLAGRISISDAEGHISGYIDATSVSGDDYSSLGFSAGFRYQW